MVSPASVPFLYKSAHCRYKERKSSLYKNAKFTLSPPHVGLHRKSIKSSIQDYNISGGYKGEEKSFIYKAAIYLRHSIN